MVSRRFTYVIDADTANFDSKVAASQAALDDLTREEAKKRREIQQFVTQSMALFNQIYSLYRTIVTGMGGAIDELFASSVTLIQGFISAALSAKLLASAQTLLGNVLAVVSLFMAGLAIGQATRTLQEVLESREETQMSIARLTARMNRERSFIGPIGGGI